MKLKKLASLVLVGGLAVGSVGCVVRAHGRVSAPVAYVEVEEEPPPPRAYIVETRPGFVFIQGRWTRNGRQWAWRDGYWERQRANSTWEDGRWERRGRGHVWVEGRWRAGARAQPARSNVRDHRDNRRNDPPPPPQGVVRDHR